MQKLFISKNDFIFQFIQLKQEDPKKIQQQQKIKKVFIIDNKANNQQSTFSFYSGSDLCNKIILYSEQKNLNKKYTLMLNIILTLVAHVKSIIPGIYRVFNNENFIIYNAYFTLIPYISVGNLISMFSRNLINLQDLNFILDYNKALSALISYESYLGLKPKHIINTPSINPLDIKSIKTWQQMRLLLNQIKKKESMMIDKCTLFLFIYFIIIMFSVFIDKILKQSILIQAGQQKFILIYYAIDQILMINTESNTACFRLLKI
ncbi:transmembrane protein, putative (macronuclear) [Tetrahymena thermophila SB210]|uniref:Transmembrane protein, putative n=1 Tax=Tetrahymena thermophila (strain SB210) TaxID=312017 RepID=W7XHG0_TETTS|nr:transmembrane protein, putative [Tetrahymena thermophila SB210]EWS73786.1 transmembrane protein, putative [Tetrahymena thermophila SB210]|eukprot:XP_012653666.1 transmembrane protein, putative [Tetrahymena thermophila SB210]